LNTFIVSEYLIIDANACALNQGCLICLINKYASLTFTGANLVTLSRKYVSVICFPFLMVWLHKYIDVNYTNI